MDQTLTPFRIGQCTIKNRFVMTAANLGWCTDGCVTDQVVRFYEARASGGVGLIIVGAAGVDPVYIAPPSASATTLAAVAASTRGYVYAVSRVGVTGTEREAETADLPRIVAGLRADAAAPVLLGFGISRPEQVAPFGDRIDAVVVGSALVRHLRDGGSGESFMQGWK